jgi:hypothetical protein
MWGVLQVPGMKEWTEGWIGVGLGQPRLGWDVSGQAQPSPIESNLTLTSPNLN